MGYKYNYIPTMYYTYDDKSNEQICGLTNDKDFMTMLRGLLNCGKNKLHVFVDHEAEAPNEPVPIKVVQPVLLLSQTPSEVEINYEDDIGYPHEHRVGNSGRRVGFVSTRLTQFHNRV